MESDKLLILKMLEEKKITAEEAAKLLESVGGGKATKKVYNHDNNTNRPNSQEGQSIDDFTSDMAKKFDNLAKDLEPKIHSLTKVIAQKTADAADKLSKTLQNYQESEIKTPPPRTAPPRPETRTYGPGKEKTFEMVVSGNENQLNLSSLNGDVFIKGYNGDKITLKLFYKSRKNSDDIEFVKLSNKYLLNYNEDDFETVSLDIFLPEKLFSNLIIDTNNGKISVSTVVCEYLIINNLNGSTALKDINCQNMKIDCNNNNLSLENIKGKIAKVENYNGSLNLTNLDVEKVKIDSFNCNINANIETYNLFEEYVWEIEASNGKIGFNLPSRNNIGYYINARTSLNNVKVGIVGLSYLANSANFIEARSINYDSVSKRILLRMETSNAPIVIN